MTEHHSAAEYIELAAEIVSAYISNNPVPPGEVAPLIGRVHAALAGLGSTQPEAKAPAEPQQPAVPIKKSVTAEYIVCLEDGRSFKSLKRHLRAKYDMSPEQYRAKWGLPSDYPMVAPNYAKARSDLAKAIGLGQVRGGAYDAAA
ncbi:MucR family transcriptional regulator [Methylobacterium dankookense]|uniref:Transcriptional regulatory protein ros n=1 Tax=Methylobacterium dankookense TaxID=560405 RepID=A0A564FT70_9HYPH|nr:MucR family transcriptional regulator [Methylobacterium dankookense]GJD57462.1 Transcriptional regulatory protein ros [Methylobacterium dankookense]VUF11242.1 Transcriptional regulatory protein ros [Methylobacterium dankookense]